MIQTRTNGVQVEARIVCEGKDCGMILDIPSDHVEVLSTLGMKQLTENGVHYVSKHGWTVQLCPRCIRQTGPQSTPPIWTEWR